jgi:uncharacterized protein
MIQERRDAEDASGQERDRASGGMSMIDPQLLEILACPLCKTPVHQDGDRLVCATCNRRYPIRDGIPVMLLDEAERPEAG